MYKALIEFTDLQDKGHVYHAEDIYPREGHTPNDKRVKELASTDNKLGRAVIAEVDEPVKVETPAAPEKKPRRRKPKQ